MAPLMLYCFTLPKDIHAQHSAMAASNKLILQTKDEILAVQESAYRPQQPRELDHHPMKPTMLDETLVCLRRPLFVWSTLGYAGHTSHPSPIVEH